MGQFFVRRILFVVAMSLWGCSAHGTMLVPGPVPIAPPGAGTDVVQKGKGAQWVTFLPKTIGALYSAMADGPDANVWFIDENAASLVRIANNGSIKELSLSGVLGGSAVSMTVGADDDFYISDETTSIARVNTSGTGVAIPIPSGDTTSLDGNALGPDGNVWFTEFNHIAKVTPGGKITEFAYPSQASPNQYGGVTAGSDGNVWFAHSSENAIGRIAPSTGKITMFTIPQACTPAPVVLAKDKNVWFACLSSSPLLGRITPSGSIATFPIGGTFSSNETEQFCARGPDGEPWCASGNLNTVFRVNTATQTVTTFAPPLPAGSRPDAVAAGSDGNVWVDTAGSPGQIDVLVINPLKLSPNALSFTATGQKKTVTVTEHGTTSWTATSSNPAVATVAHGATKSTFTVTATGSGSCRITISDGTGNSAAVAVTVT